MPNSNGYGANAFLDGLMHGYNFIDNIETKNQQRAQQAKDSAWQDEARGRQRDDWKYQDQTRESPDQVNTRRDNSTRLQGLQLDAAQRSLDSSETPDEAHARRAQESDARGLGLSSTRQAMGIRAKQEARVEREDDDKRAARVALGTIDFLNSDYAKQFDDPALRETAIHFDSVINGNQELRAGVTAPAMYDYGNKLFSRELQTGVGDNLPDGATVANKRIVAARRKGDHFVLELAITAKRPDGSTYEYNAPATKNRTSDDTDEVLEIPEEKIRERVKGAKYLAQAIGQAGGRDAALAELRRTALSLGVDPDTRSAGGQKGGAQQQYLKYIADNVFGGDIKRAYSSVRGGNVRQIAASIAKSMYDKQDSMPSSKRKSMDDLYQSALQMVQGASDEVGDAGGASNPQAAPSGESDASGTEDFSSLWGGN